MRKREDPKVIFWRHVARSDNCWLWTASINKSGYGQFGSHSHKFAAHRFSFELHKGPIPDGLQVDHICQNKRCVNPLHLRTATRKQNAENVGTPASNTSGFKNVSRDYRPSRKPWRVHVKSNGVAYSGGNFDSLEQALAAAKALRLQLFTHNDADRK
jgi:hypothetical protein